MNVSEIINRLTDAEVAAFNAAKAVVFRHETGRAWVGDLKTGELTAWSVFGRASAAGKRWLTDSRARRFASLDAFQSFLATGEPPDGFDRTDPDIRAFLGRVDAR